MPYNPQVQSTVVLSKKHKQMLIKLAKKQRRTIQATIEILIESATPSNVKGDKERTNP